jgi:hypothetical protein
MLFQTEFLVMLNKSVFDPNKNVKDDPDLFINFVSEEESGNVDDPEINPDEKSEILFFRMKDAENMLKSYEKIVSISLNLITTFTKYPRTISLHRMSIEFLSRLYYLYPKHRKSIEE